MFLFHGTLVLIYRRHPVQYKLTLGVSEPRFQTEDGNLYYLLS